MFVYQVVHQIDYLPTELFDAPGKAFAYAVSLVEGFREKCPGPMIWYVRNTDGEESILTMLEEQGSVDFFYNLAEERDDEWSDYLVSIIRHEVK